MSSLLSFLLLSHSLCLSFSLSLFLIHSFSLHHSSILFTLFHTISLSVLLLSVSFTILLTLSLPFSLFRMFDSPSH